MKPIFIEISFQVNPHVDNTIPIYGWLGVNFTVLELQYKKLFCIAFTGWEKTIYHLIT